MQPDRASEPRSLATRLLRLVAWVCVVGGACVFAWLMIQYVLLILILSGAVNIDVPIRLCIKGATVVLVSKIAVAAAIVAAAGAAFLKFVR